MRSAIVTDGIWRKSLSAIRSLGKSGYDVTVLGDGYGTTGFWSRYASERLFAPTAASSAEAFGRALTAHLESRTDRPALLPMEEATLIWVSKNRERLEKFCALLLPAEAALTTALDKGKTLEVAKNAGIPCPETFYPESADEFLKAIEGRPAGTFVVKPRSGSGSSGVSYGEPKSQDAWRAHWNTHGSCLIQERIPPEGKGLGVSVLLSRDGECIAAFAHERLKQYPISGGPSTDRVAIHAPELIDLSLKLLNAIGWAGIAMVEWKLDAEGKPRLMEINPRFWGSLELATRSGIDFPTLYANAARGEKVERVMQYRVGTRARWMMPGELLRYASDPSRENFSTFISGLPGIAEEWDLSDLRGTLATFVCTAIAALNPRYWKYVRRG